MAGDARILIVDDVPANLVAVAAALAGLDAVIITAESGAEALLRVLEQEFAVVLLDVQMPDMDGFETAALIRGRERSRHTPIIFATAINKAEAHVARGYSLGAVDYIFKPIVQEMLVAKISVFIELFEARRRGERIAEDLRRRTQELERSNAHLAELAHVAAHDLQEPLRTMTRTLRLLSRRHGAAFAAPEREFIDMALEAAESMLKLVRDLLSFARIGAQARRNERVDCENALRLSVASLKQALAETGGTVTHDQLPVVMGDEGQLTRLFQNLITNAIQFRAEGEPRIHVTSARRGASWLIQVKDNGVGIKAGDRERIFTLFERLEGTHGRPGTGLGLAICRRIVEAHGGEIWAEAGPESGSVFSFTLPPIQETPADP